MSTSPYPDTVIPVMIAGPVVRVFPRWRTHFYPDTNNSI
jgi:hypothetical protein